MWQRADGILLKVLCPSFFEPVTLRKTHLVPAHFTSTSTPAVCGTMCALVMLAFGQAKAAESKTPPSAGLSAVSVPSVKVDYRVIQDGVAWLAVPGFATNTPGAVKAILADMTKERVDYVILDLRGNKGGSLQAAIDTVSLFLGRQTPLWGYRRTNETNVKMSLGSQDKLWNGGLLVLVSSNTASAGELVASACHTSHRAQVWGQTTRGTGTVKMMRREPNGEITRWVVGEFLTANGEPIDAVGVKPDLAIAPETPDADLFSKAAKFLKSQTVTP